MFASRPRRTPRFAASIAVAIALLALAGCQDSEPEPDAEVPSSPEPTAVTVRADLMGELLDRLQPFGRDSYVTVVDLSAARAAAGTAPDADPLTPGSGGSPQERLHDASPAVENIADDNLAGIIDGTEIDAAATLRPVDRMLTVLQTSQDLEEMATSLEEAGFERDGDLLTYRGDDRAPGVPHVALGADGLVALAFTPGQVGADAALAAVARVPESSRLGTLASSLSADVEAPGLLMLPASGPGRWSCLDAVVALVPFSGPEGTYAFVPEADPSEVDPILDEAQFAAAWPDVRFGEPSQTDSAVMVTVEDAPRLLAMNDSGVLSRALVGCKEKETNRG